MDRLETVLKDFPRALLYGPGAPAVLEALTPAAGVGEAVVAGESARLLRALGAPDPVEAAPEALPFEDRSFDLVASVFSLHAADDLPRALLEARRVLKPDGLLVALFPGERTLHELRGVLQAAEAGVTGRVAPRVSPMVAVRDGGGLLQRTGFALPVADTVNVPVRYGDPLRLLADLRAMGETSTLAAGPKGALRRDVLAAAMTAYAGLADEDGVPASFDLVALTGWAPHESQPKPLKPGSARASLAEAVKGH
ncbi:methyltransferase domain-containing protein [Parvularcula dongshanensis]|uniref:SAM-dependent methyltransferase n=1 Tax=Parvularcula dongshanensis TaxID=1173995 RepID=A0A840I171_9PROT|nr:SAM-dependent methyltransferase [Parvularcula dongshanensis]